MKQWADTLILEYPDANIPILSSENDWKDWVDMLRLTGSFVDSVIPFTGGFPDFRNWACRFIENIGS